MSTDPHAVAAPEGTGMHRLLAAYPDLQPLAAQLAGLGAPLQVPAGTVLFEAGQPCAGFPLVLQGEVSVSCQAADGRALELYRVQPGELCLASSACLFRATPLAARGTALQDTALLAVPPATFHAWLALPAFRALVLGLFAERMADLTALVDAVAFQRLDTRLAAALLGHGPTLAVTHQQLADTLGTAREIVSRLLRRFERAGWVALSRERIRILDGAALRRHAQRDGPAV